MRTTDFERMAKKYHRNHVQPSRQMKDVDPTKLGSELKEFFKEEAHEPEHEVGLSDGNEGTGAEKSSSSGTGLPSSSRSPSANVSVFGGAAAKAVKSGEVPHTAARLATTAAHFGRMALGHDDDYIGDGLGERVASAAAAGKEVGNRVAEGRIHDAGKSPADRGHEGGLIGGPARAEVLTGAEKEKIARKGGYARWNEAKSERDE